MSRTSKLIALVTAMALISACSSSSKKSDTAAQPPPQQASDKGAAEAPGETSATSAESETKAAEKNAVGMSVGKGTSPSLDAKYKPLAQAIRAGGALKLSAVQDETTKLLGANPNDAVALNALALVHLRQGRPGAAKLLLSRALDKNPSTAALQNNMGVALLQEGESEAAVLRFKEALKIDDRHAEALGNLGSIYAQAGDYTKALALLEPSYKKNHTNTAVANNYAIALRASKDYEGARKVYDELLKQNSRDVAVLLNYAILLIDFMNRPKDGLELVYKVKFIETERKDVLARANALEKKAKSELK